jgi:hypothetical protein
VGTLCEIRYSRKGFDMDDSERTHKSSHKSFDASNAPDPDQTPRPESEEERKGVPPDDADATTPLGVGESIGSRGENHATSGSGGSDRNANREGGNA